MTDNPSTAWAEAEWREFFAKRVSVAESDGGIAYESCITRWMYTYPPFPPHTNSAICPYCRKLNGAPWESCRPIFLGDGSHLWLHNDCLEPWRAHWRQNVKRFLATLGCIPYGGILYC